MQNTKILESEKKESLVQRIYRTSTSHADLNALLYKDEYGNFKPQSYRTLSVDFMKFAYFLKHTCGVQVRNNITIFADNRYEWVSIDLGILSLKAVDVPRGLDTPIEELAYIMEHSDSIGCVLENISLYKKLYEHDKKLIEKQKFIIFIDDIPADEKKRDMYSYADIIYSPLSNEAEQEMIGHIQQTSPKDRATIIYTSGTTASPKGVCLSQGAFEVQIDKIVNKDVLPLKPQQTFLSILPIWHAYARELQYVVLGTGATIAYSKPIGKILLEDLQKVETHFLPSVPRIWEGVYNSIHRKVRNASPITRAIFNAAVRVGIIHSALKNCIIGNVTSYRFHFTLLRSLLSLVPYIVLLPLRAILDVLVFKKIRALLGKSFIAGVSGGGALPAHIDTFFLAAKITILEGYGLTEAAPVLGVRSLKRPQMYSVGRLFSEIEYKILNTEGTPAKKGTEGALYIRSNQIMEGYYKNEEATKQVLSEDGWLNTGDLVKQAKSGVIKILGRVKDTIVLSSGENVEPTRVEMILVQSEYIEQVFVFGQDKKSISALIVPNQEELLQYASEHNIGQNKEEQNFADLCNDSNIKKFYQHILSGMRHQFHSFEHIYNFVLIPEQFEVGIELTQTLKMKRNVISEKYKKEITTCYK